MSGATFWAVLSPLPAALKSIALSTGPFETLISLALKAMIGILRVLHFQFVAYFIHTASLPPWTM